MPLLGAPVLRARRNNRVRGRSLAIARKYWTAVFGESNHTFLSTFSSPRIPITSDIGFVERNAKREARTTDVGLDRKLHVRRTTVSRVEMSRGTRRLAIRLFYRRPNKRLCFIKNYTPFYIFSKI